MNRLPGWILVAGLVLFLVSLPLLGIHMARDHYHCLSCGSERTANQWRWGAYWPEKSIRLSDPRNMVVTNSPFYQDWLADTHAHAWIGWMRSGTYFLGIRKASTMSYGVWSPQWIADYNTDEGFRHWLTKEVTRGGISKEDLRQAARGVSSYPPGMVRGSGSSATDENPGDRWRTEYEKTRITGR